jgi:capsular polysaccharide biosynthesis protein
MEIKYFITICRWLVQACVPFLRAGWEPNKQQILNSVNSDNSITVTAVYPETESNYGIFYDDKKSPIEYTESPASTFLAVSILSISNANIALSAGIAVTASGKIVQETTFSRNKSSMRLESKPNKDNIIELSGKSLCIASDFAAGNYGHFLLDCIGRLGVFLKDNHLALVECDNILVSGPESKWKVKLLNLYNVPLDKVIWLDNNSNYCCETLQMTSFHGVKRSYPCWVRDFLYSPISTKYSAEKSKKRRLFVSRSGTVRNLKNEHALFLIAERMGFEYYLPEKSSDPIADFHHAEAVIGSHGAGLTDIIFMKEGSIVIELLPTDHKFCYFASLGKISNHIYYSVLGHSDINRPFGKQGPSPFNFSINEQDFADLLQDKLTHLD